MSAAARPWAVVLSLTAHALPLLLLLREPEPLQPAAIAAGTGGIEMAMPSGGAASGAAEVTDPTAPAEPLAPTETLTEAALPAPVLQPPPPEPAPTTPLLAEPPPSPPQPTPAEPPPVEPELAELAPPLPPPEIVATPPGPPPPEVVVTTPEPPPPIVVAKPPEPPRPWPVKPPPVKPPPVRRAEPPPPPREPPREPPPEPVVAAAPAPAPAAPAAEPAPAPPTAEAGRAGAGTAPQAGTANARTAGGVAGAPADYYRTLCAWLERHKGYPAPARARRQQGTAILAFSIDRGGRVLDWRIERSSGSALLDREVEAMLRRASPLPALPPEIVGSQLTLRVPVQFSLR